MNHNKPLALLIKKLNSKEGNRLADGFARIHGRGSGGPGSNSQCSDAVCSPPPNPANCGNCFICA